MTPATIGAIAGTSLGVLGGALGTYLSVRNVSGPRQRKVALRAAVAWWLGAGAFVGLMLVLPPAQRVWLWVPYGLLLPVGIAVTNRAFARAGAADREAAGSRA